MNTLTLTQEKIRKTLEKFVELNRVEAHIEGIDASLRDSQLRLKTLENSLDQELADIQALEKLSIKALFYKSLGSKEEQLDKERQEYLEVTLHYKQCKEEIEMLNFERNLLNKKMNDLPKVRQELSYLKEKRQEEIINNKHNPNVRNELLEVLHQLDINQSLDKEISEAILAGKKSLEVLIMINSYLNKAMDWGEWGRNSRSSAYKHHNIDVAFKLIPKAQFTLNSFTKELRDLGEGIRFRLNPIQLGNFRNFFFDNLISDWVIQQKIKSTEANVLSTIDHVKRLILSLEQEKINNLKKLTALNKEKEGYLLA